jgi:NADH:ubiquinone oxidoreductase subunit D
VQLFPLWRCCPGPSCRAFWKRVRDLVFERLPRKIDELDLYLTNNEIIRSRAEGVGVLTPDQAIAYSAVGPVLRASGVPYDIRRADPYSIYDRFDFEVAVRYHGDIYDRYLIRLDEIRQSIRILTAGGNARYRKVPSRKENLNTRCVCQPVSRTAGWKDLKASWDFI